MRENNNDDLKNKINKRTICLCLINRSFIYFRNVTEILSFCYILNNLFTFVIFIKYNIIVM